MLATASYETLPLDSGLNVGQGAVGVRVSIGHSYAHWVLLDMSNMHA